MRARAWALCFVLLGSACLGQDTVLGEDEQAIIGGSESDGFPEVVFLTSGVGACTGTLVGKRLVLTAAHCVTSGTGDVVQGGTVRFGNDQGSFTASRSVIRNLPHRRYEFGAVTRFDIAFIRLVEDAPEEMTPYEINLDPLTSADIGTTVRVVGFGVTDGAAQTGAGTKREISLSIDELTTQHIGFGSPTENICQGDSGGPTLVFGGAVPTVLAVSSFGSNECRDRSYVARTDAFPDFVREVVSAWGDGECAQDGTCNESCTEFLDPDCDICALDGVCASGCANIDLDCPLAGLVGDFCGDNDGCEGRLCVEAIDDPRVKYCSAACDENDPSIPDCDIPLTCVDSVCRYVEPTPSTQGARCDENSDCRSQICDIEHQICAEPCGSDAECSGEFACETVGSQKACTIPSEGSCLGCGFSGSWSEDGSTGVLLILVLIGYGAALRRRRSARDDAECVS